jgi:hypothetical protein
MHGSRSRTPGTKHYIGKQRVKASKSRRRSQSLIEEEVKGLLIWSWLKCVKVPKRTKAVDFERTGVRRFDTLEGFTPDICVSGEWM